MMLEVVEKNTKRKKDTLKKKNCFFLNFKCVFSPCCTKTRPSQNSLKILHSGYQVWEVKDILSYPSKSLPCNYLIFLLKYHVNPWQLFY